jgi:hypothetical protein
VGGSAVKLTKASLAFTVKDRGRLATVLLLESVMATATENGDPVVVLGTHVTVALFEVVHPVGRPLQA